MGIPTVIVTRDGFSGVVTQAFSSKGFPAEASQVVYPKPMFLPGSDLGPIDEKMDALVEGLTQWQPSVKEGGVLSPDMISIRAPSRQEAVKKMNHMFLRKLWSDGLPLEPATETAVQEMLQGTDRPRDEKIGAILPRGGIATVESLAVLMQMAGGRPEHMPVFIAAIEALVDPRSQHKRMNTTTCSVYPVVVVNGSVAEDIRLNSGYGCLGPDPNHPAGAVIGRALRLALQDMGGAVPGNTTMSIFGGPARYTGLVFAEDEAGLPEGWPSLAEEQGYPAGTDLVTVYSVASTTNIPGGETGTQDAAQASLNRAAGALSIPNGNYWFTPYNEEGSAGILLMGRGTALGLTELGWSKAEVRQYLWDHAKVPEEELTPRINTWWMPDQAILEYPMPISPVPEGITLVVAGGDQSGHMMWLQVGCCPETLVSRKMQLPSQWNTLLQQAEADLGPPAAP